MPRTTQTEVEAVLLGDIGPPEGSTDNPDLGVFIRTANVLVSRVATCATTKGLTHTSEELALMETWLAAHFYVMSDQVYASNSTGGGSASYQGQTAMRLEASKYGQSAMTMDYSGCLAAIGKGGQRAGMTWLGKTPSERIPYDQRS